MAVEDVPWAPQTSDVAPHLRLYLGTEHGARAEDFTAETAITQGDVLHAIESTVADLVASTGAIPDALHDSAKKTAAIGAAAEAVIDVDDRGRELYRELRELYEARVARLIAAVSDATTSVITGGDIAGSISMRWC